jgi:hypothetical protein
MREKETRNKRKRDRTLKTAVDWSVGGPQAARLGAQSFTEETQSYTEFAAA